jgi:chromosome segregation ATPase
MSEPARTDPSHALCVYAEPLAAGRRVVVIGDAALGLGERLSSLGARTVHVFDPKGGAAGARGTRGVTVRDLPTSDFDVRDGAFDLALVPDLDAVPEPAALLARVRRVVDEEGAVLIAARNPATQRGARIEYAELYDLVALQFEHVRMIGQLPFAGVALARLGGGEEEAVSVDTQLAPEPGEPEVFIALGAHRDLELDPYAIIQLDTAPSGADAAALAEARGRAEALAAQVEELRAEVKRVALESGRSKRETEFEVALDGMGAKLKEAEQRAGEDHLRAERFAQDIRRLEEELARQRDRGTRLTKDLEEQKRSRKQAEIELGMSRANAPKLEPLRERLAELEATLGIAEERAVVTQVRFEDATAQLAQREEQILVLATELEAVRRAAPSVDPDLIERLAARAERAEARVLVLQEELESVGGLHGQEMAQIEEQLLERAGVIQELEREVGRRERLVRELVAALEETHGKQTAMALGDVPPVPEHASSGGAADIPGSDLQRQNDELRGRLDALALDVARREGDLRSSEWRIAELTEELAGGAKKTKDGETAALRAELHALRQALAQEHEARASAESGETLRRAQAELARQATLIEQLSKELDARDRVRLQEEARSD